jgi:hypothetical protein
MKKLIFLAGIVSGCALTVGWKVVAKEGIKTGIRAGKKLRELSRQALDDLEDIAAEAKEELSKEEREADG